ncbi:MAG: hypothetical protein ICV85_06515, partial [Tolypothrix sp. T3-bin4]|nr:hypothetical protein [Tolypothrix sp. T3-bin4]
GKATPLKVVQGVGFENFYLTQEMTNSLKPEDAAYNYGNLAPEYAMHGIVFKWAANCWVRNIHTYMIGSHPIVTEAAKNLQIQDNFLDGSWNKGKGGNGYFRGSRVWDSLYYNNTLRNLRHFTFQWSASNNVAIGNDMTCELNLHGGWERRNLFELNTVRVPFEHAPGNCKVNCGNEGGGQDTGQWYPIWWGAGEKASKWSGATGGQNVFFNNILKKQLSADGPYEDYSPYYSSDGSKDHTIFQFGWNRETGDGSQWEHFSVDGVNNIADWAGNETVDFSVDPRKGVNALRTDVGSSLFLKDAPRKPDPDKKFQTVPGITNEIIEIIDTVKEVRNKDKDFVRQIEKGKQTVPIINVLVDNKNIEVIEAAIKKSCELFGNEVEDKILNVLNEGKEKFQKIVEELKKYNRNKDDNETGGIIWLEKQTHELSEWLEKRLEEVVELKVKETPETNLEAGVKIVFAVFLLAITRYAAVGLPLLFFSSKTTLKRIRFEFVLFYQLLAVLHLNILMEKFEFDKLRNRQDKCRSNSNEVIETSQKYTNKITELQSKWQKYIDQEYSEVEIDIAPGRPGQLTRNYWYYERPSLRVRSSSFIGGINNEETEKKKQEIKQIRDADIKAMTDAALGPIEVVLS